jgi:threonine aldolase
LIAPSDLAAIRDRIGAFLVELPQREIGAQLPAWDDLLELCKVAREREMRLHLDGARLWEAAPHYGRSHAEIAALFDSVYVSFYKGLGGIAGAVLAGDADFIAEARVWQHRHGGRLVSLYPFVLAAQRGFEERLPRMAGYRERARAIAARLAEIGGVHVNPNPPHTNTFHVLLPGTKEELEGRAHAIARETGVWSFGSLYPTIWPQLCKWEFVTGDATADVSDDEIVAIVEQIVAP